MATSVINPKASPANVYVAIFWGRGAGNSSKHTTYDNLTGQTYFENSDYATFDSEHQILTFSRAGTYKISRLCAGVGYTYNASTATTSDFRLYQNDTIIDSATGVGEAGAINELTITAAVGDTIRVTGRNSTDRNYWHRFNYIIYPSA